MKNVKNEMECHMSNAILGKEFDLGAFGSF